MLLSRNSLMASLIICRLEFFIAYPFFQPPPLDLYHFAAQPLAYAEG